MGGITRAEPDAVFPEDSDLDLVLLVDRPTTTKDPLDELYRGVAIEAGVRGIDEYASPEKVLANPEIADHIAVGAIVADPVGILEAVQPVVARDFARRRWVILRCEEEKRRFETGLEAVRLARAPGEFMLHLMLALQNLASLIAVALLVPPTHRKFLVLLREQLDMLDRLDLFEKTLAASGIRDMSRARVQWYQDQTSIAFDRALEVKRTPVPFDFKLRPHLRPYLIDGYQSMINAGNYREAMPWIAAGIFLTTAVLLNDAPENERPRYAALMEDLLRDLGLEHGAGRQERFALAAELANEIYRRADDIAAGRPDGLVPA